MRASLIDDARDRDRAGWVAWCCPASCWLPAATPSSSGPTAARKPTSAPSCAGSPRPQRAERRRALRADRPRAVGDDPLRTVGVADRVRADGPRPRPVRFVDARGRPPPAVRQPHGRTTSSAGGCSATRASRRPTPTAGCTWRTTARSSAPTSPTSRSTSAIRSVPPACAASSCATSPAAPGCVCSASSRRGFRSSDRRVRRTLWKILAVQAVLFAASIAAGYPLVYPLLWFLPYLTVWRVINRLRSIAEHGGLEASSDRRITTHSVTPAPDRPVPARAVQHRLAPRPPRRRRRAVPQPAALPPRR